jgi:hypothetical protein
VILSSRVSGNTVQVQAGTDTANADGGALLGPGRMTVKRSTLDRNTVSAGSTGSDASASGAGILTFGGPFELRESTVSRNVAWATAQDANVASAGRGTVELETVASALIVNSTLAANAARGFAETGSGGGTGQATAGGLFVGKSVLELRHATIARNSVGGRGQTTSFVGGGLYTALSTVNMRGVLVAENRSLSEPDCHGAVSSQGDNLIDKLPGCVSKRRERPTSSARTRGSVGSRAGADQPRR